MKPKRPKVEKQYRDKGLLIMLWRNHIGMTQEQLAMLTNVSRAHIANMERGEQRIWPHQLQVIAGALGCEGL